MARKMTAQQYAQDFGEPAETANRRPIPQMMPYLVPFQPQTKIHQPKRRLEIAIEVKSNTDDPYPVKIIHNV